MTIEHTLSEQLHNILLDKDYDGIRKIVVSKRFCTTAKVLSSLPLSMGLTGVGSVVFVSALVMSLSPVVVFSGIGCMVGAAAVNLSGRFLTHAGKVFDPQSPSRQNSVQDVLNLMEQIQPLAHTTKLKNTLIVVSQNLNNSEIPAATWNQIAHGLFDALPVLKNEHSARQKSEEIQRASENLQQKLHTPQMLTHVSVANDAMKTPSVSSTSHRPKLKI